VILTVTLSPGASIISVSPGTAINGNVVTFSVPDLASAAIASFTITVAPPEPGTAAMSGTAVPCPQCGATAGKSCRVNGVIVPSHPQRLNLVMWQRPKHESPFHTKRRLKWRGQGRRP
jgi:hypothetical protein